MIQYYSILLNVLIDEFLKTYSYPYSKQDFDQKSFWPIWIHHRYKFQKLLWLFYQNKIWSSLTSEICFVNKSTKYTAVMFVWPICCFKLICVLYHTTALTRRGRIVQNGSLFFVHIVCEYTYHSRKAMHKVGSQNAMCILLETFFFLIWSNLKFLSTTRKK